MSIAVPEPLDIPSPLSGPVGVQNVVAPARRHIPDTDLWVFPLALGAQRFVRTIDQHTAIELLDRYREGGGNLIDTVDALIARPSERLIGAWLAQRGCRDDVVIATTVGGGSDFPGLTPVNVRAAVDASLQRLGVERLDLLFLREAPGVPVELEESLGAIDALIRAGKVGHIAAAGFSAERLLEARVLAANGLPAFRAIQTRYSLGERDAFESSVSVVAAAQGLAVFPSGPLAHGVLAGRDGDDPRPSRALRYLGRRGQRTQAVLDRVANDHGVTSATIAIAWLLAKRGVVAPVTGARSIAELHALMAAPRVRLTRADMLDLDRVTR
ncbi:aldo/keto reductase [Rathayibacter sp. YIM 133350]|uniref:aldo/keto reductase n=1 Tax=Rathayibacter sp. YIM 133350 TaxID=3131992 RepID=UPI00307D41E6